MAPTGTPEYALTDGTVAPVAGANRNGWNTLGGYTLMLEADYSVGPVKKGDLFYYAHLRRESTLEIGTRVRAGQVIGYAGDTGQGPEVTRGLFPPHLHLGWYDATAVRSSLPSGAMNPYPLLEWMKANDGTITGGSKARYCEAPQTGVPTPSTGETHWPTPDSHGVSPDLDTGSSDPTPTPTAPAKRDDPAPNEGPRDAPERVSPEPQTPEPSSSRTTEPPAPRDESSSRNGASGGGGSRDLSDTPDPAPGNEPEENRRDDRPDEGQEVGRDEVEEKGEKAGSEEGSRPPDEASPDEDQYAPETGAE
jgi:hypothetical protein